MSHKNHGVKDKNYRFSSVITEALELDKNLCQDCDIIMKPDLPLDEGTGDYAVLCGFTCPKCKKFYMSFGERDASRKKV